MPFCIQQYLASAETQLYSTSSSERGGALAGRGVKPLSLSHLPTQH